MLGQRVRNVFFNKGKTLRLLHLETIQAYVKSVESTIGAFSPIDARQQLAVPEPPSLLSARLEIEAVCRDLRRLLDSCGTKAGPKRINNIRRVKYTWKSRDIKKMQSKVERSRQQLHLSLTEMLLLCVLRRASILVNLC